MNDIIFAGNMTVKGERDAHSHRGYEIVCPDFDGEIKVGKESFAFAAGEIVVIPPLTKHAHVTGKSYLSVVLEHALLPIKNVTVIRADTADILSACRRAEYYFLGGKTQFQGVVKALGELVAALIAAFAGGSDYSPVVRTVLSDIDKNVSNSAFSLEDCIGALPLNYDYVRKLFKKETGLTPHEYLLKSRMALAKSIISSGVSNQYSRYTVSQIAEMCGFSEPLYFSRVFKKYYGFPPSQQLT